MAQFKEVNKGVKLERASNLRLRHHTISFRIFIGFGDSRRRGERLSRFLYRARSLATLRHFDLLLLSFELKVLGHEFDHRLVLDHGRSKKGDQKYPCKLISCYHDSKGDSELLNWNGLVVKRVGDKAEPDSSRQSVESVEQRSSPMERSSLIEIDCL